MLNIVQRWRANICVCRRRQRKIRSRSHYTLHDAELTGSTQTFDGGRDSKQTGSGIYSTAGRPIYKRSSCGGTWQRTRPLPVPRLPSNTGDDEEDADVARRGTRDDDDVIAMTPLTSACSEHLLVASGGGGDDDGVLNAVGPAAPCCTAADGVESTAAAAVVVRCRAPCCPGGDKAGPGPVAHGRTRSTPQPIDAARLLLLGGDRAPCGGGYERCVADTARGVPSSGGGGPYYFKLDLTSGLSPGDRAGESPAACMMCVQQQQQQQQHATLPRRITASPPPPPRQQRY